MADGDFLDLQNQLALMVGAEDISLLPESEQTLIKKTINRAYQECYTPMDGLRPGWTMQNFAKELPASTEISVTVTEGSTTVQTAEYEAIDATFEFVGSFMKLGDRYYTRQARIDATNFSVLEPIQASSGTHTATVFFNSFRIPVQAIDIAARPELVGDGLLSVMNGKENELVYRSLITGDFYAGTGLGNQRTINFNTANMTFEEGRPLFYFIDQSMFGNGIENRFVLYPLPVEKRLVKYRGNIVPTALSADGDLPLMPTETVNSILLPMARYAYCAVTRRYNGDNRGFLREDADQARLRLRSFARSQKQTRRRIKVRPGYA